MAKVKQLTVALENQPGRLAAVAKVLADAKVNVEAVLAAPRGRRVPRNSWWTMLLRTRRL